MQEESHWNVQLQKNVSVYLKDAEWNIAKQCVTDD